MKTGISNPVLRSLETVAMSVEYFCLSGIFELGDT